ncbi:hypothetical protein SLA2020_522030 [Shorea laevis]
MPKATNMRVGPLDLLPNSNPSAWGQAGHGPRRGLTAKQKGVGLVKWFIPVGEGSWGSDYKIEPEMFLGIHSSNIPFLLLWFSYR